MIGAGRVTRFKLFTDLIDRQSLDDQLNDWASKNPDACILDVKFANAWDEENQCQYSQALVIYVG